jgi:6-phosphogluconate dehydrogenase
MGANIVRRVMHQGHECVVYDRDPQVVPAGQVTTSVIDELAQTLQSGDTVIDGGNTYYRDDIRHAQKLGQRGVHLLDCGTSGGVWGLQRGHCLMIGGDSDVVAGAEPIFASVAPGVDTAPRTPGRTGQIAPSEQGYLRCGPTGAGHHADIGTRSQHSDAETAPLEDPGLLDLTAAALQKSPQLSDFTGRVSDSGEGRWTCLAAIEEGVPAPVLTTALYSRFASRHLEKPLP